MRTVIIILPALGQNRNSAIYQMRAEIKAYFGTKITEVSEDYATVKIEAEVTQDDINHLEALVNNVKLLAIITPKEWDNPSIIKLGDYEINH